MKQTPKHWISSGYLHLKDGTSQRAYKLNLDQDTPQRAASRIIASMNEDIARMNRSRRMLHAFVNGNTTQDPDALKP